MHVVEDDDATREATCRLLQAAGHSVKPYASASDFLAALGDTTSGCVVLDLQLPGASGLDLQQVLAAGSNPLPIVFLTGHGGVSTSVHAMKSGAVDFLEKSADGELLLDAVSRALAKDEADREHRRRQQDLRTRFDRLTHREREVFVHLISGQLNKQVSFDLGISEATIKIHRHRVLAKMEADSVVELARMAADLGIGALIQNASSIAR